MNSGSKSWFKDQAELICDRPGGQVKETLNAPRDDVAADRQFCFHSLRTDFDKTAQIARCFDGRNLVTQGCCRSVVDYFVGFCAVVEKLNNLYGYENTYFLL